MLYVIGSLALRALISQGVGPTEIAKRVGIKRASVYHILEDATYRVVSVQLLNELPLAEGG
jgi:hypothetical protein